MIPFVFAVFIEMADIYSKEKRSDIMSCIPGKNTKPETIVGKFLFARGLRYRKNASKLPGSPDLFFRKYKTAVFVNGCFWHGHENCKLFRIPLSNRSFWEKKIADNKARDARKQQELEALGYRVLVIWQCQINPKMREENLVSLYENIIK